MRENEIAKVIVDCAYKIYMRYGPGLLESVYTTILAYELNKCGLEVEHEKTCFVIHDGIKLDQAFRIDLLVAEKVLVEVKAVEELANVHRKQVNTYLKITGIKLALLINFGGATFKGNCERIVNGLEE